MNDKSTPSTLEELVALREKLKKEAKAEGGRLSSSDLRYRVNEKIVQVLMKRLGCTLIAYNPGWEVQWEFGGDEIKDWMMGKMARLAGLPWLDPDDAVPREFYGIDQVGPVYFLRVNGETVLRNVIPWQLEKNFGVFRNAYRSALDGWDQLHQILKIHTNYQGPGKAKKVVVSYCKNDKVLDSFEAVHPSFRRPTSHA
jgi:hypothetical protein